MTSQDERLSEVQTALADVDIDDIRRKIERYAERDQEFAERLDGLRERVRELRPRLSEIIADNTTQAKITPREITGGDVLVILILILMF